ncbi:MAG: hypothetical protein AB7E80_01525 [Hyphomicrobiaceae bacterium]
MAKAGALLAVLAAAVAGMALATSTRPADAGIDRACVSACRSQNNQCRIATKNSPSCDQQLQRCLDSCRR